MHTLRDTHHTQNVVNNFVLNNILTRIGLFKEFETTITINKNVLKKELEKDIDTWENEFCFDLGSGKNRFLPNNEYKFNECLIRLLEV